MQFPPASPQSRRGHGKVYYQEYSRGIPTTEFKQTGTTQSGERHGTKITFHPDPEIFRNVLEFWSTLDGIPGSNRRPSTVSSRPKLWPERMGG